VTIFVTTFCTLCIFFTTRRVTPRRANGAIFLASGLRRRDGTVGAFAAWCVSPRESACGQGGQDPGGTPGLFHTESIMSEAMSVQAMQAMQAEITQLKERLAQRSRSRISLKVSEKGAVSLYGLGRFPVTLYESQWSRLLDYLQVPAGHELRSFMRENTGRLSHKD
jgi:hypothetical protein